MAFYKQAQLALRHADDAVQAAQQARLSGHVSVGLAPTTSAVLAMPFMTAMRERYPDVRLRMVETLSGNLEAMLNARQLDLAVLFSNRSGAALERAAAARRAAVPDRPARHAGAAGHGAELRACDSRRLGEVPLVLPSGSHGLRAIVDAAFARVRCEPRIVLEVDGLAVLMDAVRAGIGATIQPGAATARLPEDAVARIEIADRDVRRLNLLASLSDDELAPAALAARDRAARRCGKSGHQRWTLARRHPSRIVKTG